MVYTSMAVKEDNISLYGFHNREALELFENVSYLMAKHADPAIPSTVEEWLDGFNTFSIYQILPQIIELWGLNVQTAVQSKKNFAQRNAK